jgi:putative ABC transport system permease protein
MSFWNRIRQRLMRAGREEELSEEMRTHREMLEERFVREGMSNAEAKGAAARKFGNELGIREEARDQWGFGWLDGLLGDARFALRRLRKQPALTAAAVLTIGLGVGANTAVVSVIETVLLNPLGMRDTGRVLAATVRLDKLQMRHASTSAAEFRDLQSMPDAFEAVAASEGRAWTSRVNGEPMRLLGQAVTPDYFAVFGEKPRAGRFFSTDDREAAVLSHRLWQAQFGGDPSVLGRAIMLDGQPHRIVGIAPPSFRFPADAQLWTPLVLTPKRLVERGNNMNLALFARLRDGVSPEQGADRVNRYAAGLFSNGADGAELSKLGYAIDLEPFACYVAGDLRRPLLVLWAAALLVLFTACANVAALLLSRVTARQREMAIRLGLGATRPQILRQLAVESLLLGGLGGLFGVALAALALAFLTRLTIPGRQMFELVALDRALMLYGLGLSLTSGLVFGIAPAVQLLRASQAQTMKRRSRHSVQNVFVAAEVAIAVVLLIGTGLLVRSFRTLAGMRPGFYTQGVTTAYLIKPQNDPGFLNRLETALRDEPGVRSAALAYPLPFSGGGLTSMFSIRGRERQGGEPEWHGEAFMVSPGFFETLRIPLLRGRGLSGADNADSPLVCVIDEKLTQRFFPNEEPLGQEIAMYKGWARIVGVVRGIRSTSLEQSSRPAVYYSLAQVPFFPEEGILVRSSVPGGPAIRDAVRRANGSVPLFDVRTLEDRIAESLGIRQVMAALISVFGAVCLLLAVVGLNGVVAQVAAERGPEFGIRMALGARPSQILAGVLGRGMLAGGVGLVAGATVSMYTQRWLGGLLFDPKPSGASIFAPVGAGVAVVLLVAIYWPARRASRLDPQSILRCE